MTSVGATAVVVTAVGNDLKLWTNINIGSTIILWWSLFLWPAWLVECKTYFGQIFQIVSVLGQEEGYAVKYSLSPREILREEAEGSGYISQYILTGVTIQTFFYLPICCCSSICCSNCNIDLDVAVKLIASVEEVLAAMLTPSHCNSHSHRH